MSVGPDIAALLAGGGGPPGASADPANPDRGAPGEPGSITSGETGSALDLIRTAIQALQHYAEQTHDDQDIHAVTKCITALQGILAGAAKGRDAAMGMTPSLRHVKRTSRGY